MKLFTKTKAAKSSNNAGDDLRLFAVHHGGAVHREQAENNRDGENSESENDHTARGDHVRHRAQNVVVVVVAVEVARADVDAPLPKSEILIATFDDLIRDVVATPFVFT